ncbi:MAG TPA: glucokinase [Candidatus Acidoferrales bacterium]|nr:glucokinase [Candidatus Acidoferrales bacterium]
MILAGDLGGTKCTLILFDICAERLRPLFRLTAKTADFPDIESFLDNFRKRAQGDGHSLSKLSAAGFGVAGAIVNDAVVCNNLPWTITRQRIAEALKIEQNQTMLLNDVEAASSSLNHLEPRDLLELNPGTPQARAPKLYVAAGTGLGESILFWNGDHYQVSACEAGLTDFAPASDREIVVLQYLRQRMPLVCTEEVVSGRGFRAIHEAIFPEHHHPFFDNPDVDSAASITQQGFSRDCAACEETLHMWTEAYGSEAGNMALRSLPFGGVYVGGGIALKILAKLKDGTFVRAFCNKTKLADELARIPIFVVLNQDAPVLGAGYAALAAVN